MNEDPLLVSIAGARTTLTLNRPEVLNALHTPLHFALEKALDDFAANDTQRVCVIRGAGDRAFCAGSDLKYAAAMHAEGNAHALRYPPHGYAGLIERFDLAKPVIAMVNGIAFGGGFEIALACDLIIASDTARFAFPEPLVGAVALAGGLHRLARQIGLKQAMGMILSCRRVSAEEGRQLGFVNEVVPQSEIEAATARWIDAILMASPAAIAASKQSIMRGLDEPSLAAAIVNQNDYPEYRAWIASGDAWEGAQAFANKRAPTWQSR